MGTLVSSTSPLLRRWRQLDSFHRKVITFLVVYLLLVLTLSIANSPEEQNTAGAAPTSPSTRNASTPQTAVPVAVRTVTVTDVVDGRTITGSNGEQVVVGGLGRPGQCWAEAALTFAKTTLLGKQVRVDADVVILDGEDFAVLMAGRGHGRADAGARTAVSDAQETAKQANLGLWGAPCGGSDEPPPPPPATTTPVTTPATTSALTAVPPPAAPGPVTARFEAETSPAVCSGTVDSNWPGYSGSGFCNATNTFGAYSQFTVTSSTAGSATVVVRFANGSTAARPAVVLVNGTRVASVSFEVTGNWSAWFSRTLTIPLPAGSSAIQFTPVTQEGLPNIDAIDATTL
ncbi:MAG: carbohydrate-binding protein [Umezawaea sp.]